MRTDPLAFKIVLNGFKGTSNDKKNSKWLDRWLLTQAKEEYGSDSEK